MDQFSTNSKLGWIVPINSARALPHQQWKRSGLSKSSAMTVDSHRVQ